MALKNIVNTVNNISEEIVDYVRSERDLVILDVSDKVASAASSIVGKVIAGFVGLMVLMMLSCALAVYINNEAGSDYKGYFIVAGIYVVLGIILYAFRTQIIGDKIYDETTKILNKK